MFIDMEKRKYTLRKRAVSREATRARIVEALMQLHEEVGPGRASIAAVAERAGVQRLTVYRHFPDETSMFRACASRWLELNPPPDPAAWAAAADPAARCRASLAALYAYYGATARMWTVSFRDEDEVPALAEQMTGFRAYLAAIRDDLLAAFGPPAAQEAALRATLGHAVRFQTWASLAEEGCGAEKAAALAAAWAEAAAAPG